MLTTFPFKKGILQILPISTEIGLGVREKVIMWHIGDRFYEVDDIIHDVFCMF